MSVYDDLRRDEYGLRVVTEFTGDAIGIDPDGCGCMDCLTGSSVPMDHPDARRLAEAVLAGDRSVVNRTGRDMILVENWDGGAEFQHVLGSARIHSIHPDD